MKTKLLLLNVMLFAGMLTNANAQGKWVDATSNYFWEYDLGTGTDTKTGSSSDQSYVSTNASATFLPSPPNGNVKAYLKKDIGGSIAYGGGKITITSPTSDLHKISAYGMDGASSVTSIFFTLNFNNNLATNGDVILGIGNSNGLVFTNTSQVTNASSANALFTALRFYSQADNSQVKLRYLNGSSYSDVYVDGSNFINKNEHQIEIYTNNSSGDRKYVRETVEYTVPSRKFHCWIDGKQMSTNSGGTLVDVSATGLGATSDNIDAVVFTVFGSTTPSNNSLNISLSNLKLGQIPSSVLPVNLTGFTAQKQGNKVQLNWSTASETNNHYFELLRSANSATDFKSIHKTPGNGTTSTANKYSYTDYAPLAGTNYYQLKQVDNNGETKGTWVQAVNVELGKPELTGYVNSLKQLQVSYSATVATNAKLYVTDLNGSNVVGKTVVLSKGNNVQTIDLGALANGIYIVTLVEPNYKGSIKIKL